MGRVDACMGRWMHRCVDGSKDDVCNTCKFALVVEVLRSKRCVFVATNQVRGQPPITHARTHARTHLLAWSLAYFTDSTNRHITQLTNRSVDQSTIEPSFHTYTLLNQAND